MENQDLNEIGREYKRIIPFGKPDHCLEVGSQGFGAESQVGIQEAVAGGCIDELDGVRTTHTYAEPYKTLWGQGEKKGKAIMSDCWRFERKKQDPPFSHLVVPMIVLRRNTSREGEDEG